MCEELKYTVNEEDLAKVAGGTEDLTEEEKFALLFQEIYRLLEEFDEKEVFLMSIIKKMENMKAAGCPYEDVKQAFFDAVSKDMYIVSKGKLVQRALLLP